MADLNRLIHAVNDGHALLRQRASEATLVAWVNGLAFGAIWTGADYMWAILVFQVVGVILYANAERLRRRVW
jgi:hypothetical protein